MCRVVRRSNLLVRNKQWYKSLGQHCSISVVKQYFSINYKINGWVNKIKGWGAPCMVTTYYTCTSLKYVH